VTDQIAFKIIAYAFHETEMIQNAGQDCRAGLRTVYGLFMNVIWSHLLFGTTQKTAS